LRECGPRRRNSAGSMGIGFCHRDTAALFALLLDPRANDLLRYHPIRRVQGLFATRRGDIRYFRVFICTVRKELGGDGLFDLHHRCFTV
jgi:hypothetical protein